ncbi:MAG TPA: diguanylate cyclase [Candidatus Krumholzibacteria bacterium]|nr:diguanylate cyclase [Candidatus Krumholzibacteria bacterium]
MQFGFVDKVKGSFSAKIILLVAISVILTSFVVGLATTRSTGKFLTDRMKDRFPSLLTTTTTRVRLWTERERNDAGEIARFFALRQGLERLKVAHTAKDRVHAEKELAHQLHSIIAVYPEFEDILLFDGNGALIATARGDASEDADDAWIQLGELGFDEGVSQPVPDARGFHQWYFVPTGDSTGDKSTRPWVAVRVNFSALDELLGEVKLGPGGDVFLLDGQGRFVTQPRLASERLVGNTLMQVPTRQTGPVTVERRNSYPRIEGQRDRAVFHSKLHLDQLGCWLVYEEDYQLAMAPVLEASRRIWVSVLIVGAIAILAALRIAQSILKPIKGLALGARRINEGLVGVKIPRGADDEIGLMIETFNEMAMKITLSQAELQYKNKMLNSQNDRLQEMNERLEKLSVTDGLTGLFNHRHFWNLMNTEMTRVNLSNGNLALVLIDLDDFKRVNDKFGHSVGDVLLKTIADVLSDAVRDTDIVARYGGEEFAVMLPDTDDAGVQNVAEKLRAAVETIRFNVPDTDITLKVTVSIGVSVFRGNRREFFNAADRALYQSKAAGKNCVHYALT